MDGKVVKKRRRHSFSVAKDTKYLTPVFAAIDLGTTNCRLLIATPMPTGFAVKETFSKITRLGEGLVSNGVLSERAIKRTIHALRLCVKKLSKYNLLYSFSTNNILSSPTYNNIRSLHYYTSLLE